MKNYTDSDYALNKFSEGIVYKFADRIVEVTLEDYLSENPDRTEQDFRELKELSDAIYLDQVRAENSQTRKNIPIHGMEETRDLGGIPIDEQYIEMLDKQYATEAIALLLESGLLTDVQERRFRLLIFGGLSKRKIALMEGVHKKSVDECIAAVLDKLKKISANL